MSLAAAAYRYVFAEHRMGGLALALAGTPIVCRPSGALWIETAGVLIVADLHLEKGSSFAVRGQLLPPHDSKDTLARLEAEAAVLAPRLIVLLGDTFHDAGSEDRLAETDRAWLRALGAGRSMVFVTGNHDAEGPHGFPGDSVGRLTIAGLDLVHEPSSDPAGGEVAGHLHPCARLRGYGMGVRRRCFITDGERIVLPAFGAFAGGLNVRDLAFRPLFRRSPLAAILGAARVHAVGWRSLGGD